MIFKLPNYSDLTNQQREVVNYNPESNLVIQGYPGTGKSVLAIYKAKNFVEQEKKVLLLVFNRPLKEYMATGVKEAAISLEIDTWNNWLNNFYILNFGCVPPQYREYLYKWNEIHQQFHELHEKYGIVYDQIVIDEGQDLPKELYESSPLEDDYNILDFHHMYGQVSFYLIETTKEFSKWLTKLLKNVGKTTWWDDYVKGYLTANDKNFKLYQKLLSHLTDEFKEEMDMIDLSTQCNIFYNALRKNIASPIFAPYVGNTEIIEKLQDARNTWAHLAPMSIESSDADNEYIFFYNLLIPIADFLASINASKSLRLDIQYYMQDLQQEEVYE